MSDKELKPCAECGASVYPEHIAAGKAGEIDGRLRCPHCLAEYKKTHHTDEARFTGQTSMRAPGEGADFSKITVDDAPVASSSMELTAIGGETFVGADLHDESYLKRPLITEGVGATRSRTFHAKLNDGAVAFMNKHINEWADENPNVVIKHATSTIGVWEGKKADPHLIVTVFY
jgi:hypothetical protein